MTVALIVADIYCVLETCLLAGEFVEKHANLHWHPS